MLKVHAIPILLMFGIHILILHFENNLGMGYIVQIPHYYLSEVLK